MDVRPGTVIDKFEVIRPLGAGAMASVHLVRHIHLDAPYALKVLQINRPEIIERLLTEGRVQAALRHPNVVGVSDVILVGEHPGLVLEYVEGPTLETFIRDYAPLSLEDIDQIGQGIVKGLRAAHRAGHLHRDLKPANILMDFLDEEWIPKIADFGLAKFLFTGGGEVSITRTGQIMGSPTFMSPEQIKDAKTVDERADVFALGAVLYELCTGVRCFNGPDVVSVFARIVSGAFTPVNDLRADIPPRMVMAIHGALVTDAAHRIPDTDTFFAVWRGERVFEANQEDATESVVRLLGDHGSSASLRSFTGLKSQPGVATHPGISASVKRPIPKRRRRIVGSVTFLFVLFTVSSVALVVGFFAVYAGAGLYYRQAPQRVVELPPVEPVVVEPDPVEPTSTPAVPVVSEPPAPVEPVAVEFPSPVEPSPRPDPTPTRPEPVPRPVPEPPSPQVPKPLSMMEFDETIRRSKASFGQCFTASIARGENPPKRVFVDIRVASSGTVADAAVREGAVARHPAAACLVMEVRKVRFRAFEGPPYQQRYPFEAPN